MLSLTCGAFLQRDLALCTDKEQLRAAYQLAIRAYILALLQPPCFSHDVRNRIRVTVKELFEKIVQEGKIQLEEDFVVNSVEVFMKVCFDSV
jgi:hypothetical protein